MGPKFASALTLNFPQVGCICNSYGGYVTVERNKAEQEAKPDAKDGQGFNAREYLCQRDIALLALHLYDGHSLSQIASWQKTHRGTVKRRMERAIRTLVNAGVPVAGVRRERVDVIPVSRLRLKDGVGLDDL